MVTVARREYTPHVYQGLMTKHQIDVPRNGTWAGMGLGKTVSTLTALDALFLSGETHPALVIGPLRVAKNVWPAEARKWAHLRHIHVMPITGTETERRNAMRYDASVYTVNYDNLPWLVKTYGQRWPFRTVVADESTRLKGFRLKQGTERAKALATVSHTKVKRFIQLTGTPAPNGLKDLWGQAWFLDAGQRLGRTYQSFEDRWFAYKRKSDAANPKKSEIQTIIMPWAQVEIHDKMRDLCLTIDAKDYFDVRDPIIRPVYVELPPKARIKYREMEKDMYTELEGRDVEAFNAAARTQKLLQMANGAVYVNPDADSDEHPKAKEWREVHDVKLDALASIVEEANGMPVFVAYEFKSDLARILRAFPKARFLDDDQQTEDAWNAGKIPMLVAHPKSAGHGLNLQDGGNIIVYFGHNWDLELYLQILERIGPMRQLQSGHNRPVFVYPIIARDTVDETVMARRENKRSVQDNLLEAMKARVS